MVTYLAILLGSLWLLSCAVHARFPFICFQKACVMGQLGLHPGALRKSVNAIVYANKKRRRRKAGDEKEYSSAYRGKTKEKALSPGDTLSPEYGRFADYRRIKLVFLLREGKERLRDSLALRYANDGEYVAPEDDERLEAVVSDLKLKNIHRVEVYWLAKKEESRLLKRRSRKLLRYLKRFGLPAKKVLIVPG